MAAAVHVVTNQGLLWGALQLIRRDGRLTERVRAESSLTLLLASDLGYAVLGLLIAALWTVTYAFAAVLVLVPLIVARWAMGQFAEQQRAYSATMEALCQAVETKDFYTRGHSERVSRGSGMIAREIGMRPDRVDAIRYAGMLHDVGKLGVPTKVLQKDGPLSEEEYAAIQLHPMRGLEPSSGRSASSTRRSPASCIITSGSTARATRWVSPRTRFPSSPGSSRWPTPSTR